MGPGILFDPLVVAAIAGSLSALILIVDAIVNNYGEVAIRINGGRKELTVRGGAPLLATLAENRIYIPSACGGRGSCGACKLRVTTDIGPLYPTEKPYMSPEEAANGTRLSCQVKVKTALDIVIPDELFNVRQFACTVESIRDVTYDIKEVRFRLDDPSSIEFTAGQYMQVEVPPYDKIAEPTQRAYSMSSIPSDTGHVEFLIRLVPGGTVTTYVFSRLKEGDKAKLVGPFGEFMRRDTGAVMVCVAGGSGMAPIKSIIHDMRHKGETAREVWFFFGARSVKDLFYVDEFVKLEKEWPSFHFVPALSQPDPGDTWEGATGIITEVLGGFLKNRIDPTRPREGYLCGSPGMINACVAVMTDNGMAADSIYYDKFA